MADGRGAVIEVFCPERVQLGEGPVWDARTETLYWVDIVGGTVLSQTRTAAKPDRVQLGVQVGCLGLTTDPDVLVAGMRSGWHLLAPRTGARHFIADPEADRESCRFNDGGVDPGGRFWTGSLEDREATPDGRLYTLHGDGRYTVADEGFFCSNGIDWSPDGRSMYFVDSRQDVIFRYAFDVGSGRVTGRSVFVDTTALSGIPDGLRVDAAGDVWCAFWDGAHLTRFSPDGTVVERVPVPVIRPTSIAFGGPDLRTMYITSAAHGLTDEQRQRWPLSGTVLHRQVQTPGSPAHHFETTGTV